ncbi:interferon-inducible GTPase 1-like [Paramacrobiotus metropolitanus]|uniref:interferon-inducible GTPase 1-like n=1 Tax=Paramacrobiotus metropolitanus TaxID=2943436 RepID=UPI002445B517|nr:interferon-inducible GTPase 1-like [Paramacrobiotus metropolitanus]
MAGITDDNHQVPIGFLGDEEQKEVEEIFRKGGTAGFAKLLHERNERWKTVPLNIAIIGQSGAGKSSYINCSRNVTAEDEGSAAVGITETTATIRSYPHPDNKLLLYWDLPGVGTPSFPRDSYLEKINFIRYDFYFILSCSRFSESDLWLSEQAKKRGKKFFFVRTKSGIDVQNQRNSYPRISKEKSDDEILEHVRSDIIAKLGLQERETGNVFLIDSHVPGKYDMAKLQQRLVGALPELKRETFLYSLNPMGMLSKKVIQEKAEYLKSRVWMVSLASGIFGLHPLPGLSSLMDLQLIRTQFIFYLHQMGLDLESLTKTADVHEIDVQLLQKEVVVHLELPDWSALDKDNLSGSLMKDLVYQEKERPFAIAREAIKLVPLIGSLAGLPSSYVCTREALLKILTRMENAANAVINFCVNTVQRKALDETAKECEKLKN